MRAGRPVFLVIGGSRCTFVSTKIVVDDHSCSMKVEVEVMISILGSKFLDCTFGSVMNHSNYNELAPRDGTVVLQGLSRVPR